jgi:hypothetical protein
MTWREWSLDDCDDGWSHHGLATLPDGTIVGYHPRDQLLLFFDADGTLVRTAPCEATEAHDITLAADGEHLWIADCGNKLRISASGTPYADPPDDEARGRVLLVDLNGTTVRTIDRLGDGPFRPTGVAVDERGVWVADGYGSNRVHLVDHEGAVLVTLEGFDCPHGIMVDRRGPAPLLYIAERGQRRLAVHDLDGGFLRHAGVGDLLAPCAMTTRGDRLYVADLVSRVTVLDADDRLVEHVGGDREATRREGWPNAVVDGRTVRPPLTEGRFNSPHGITTVGDGIVVTEWLLGGRWVRLGGR